MLTFKASNDDQKITTSELRANILEVNQLTRVYSRIQKATFWLSHGAMMCWIIVRNCNPAITQYDLTLCPMFTSCSWFLLRFKMFMLEYQITRDLKITKHNHGLKTKPQAKTIQK